MATYQFKAKDRVGRLIEGEREAVSRVLVLEELSREGLTITQIHEKRFFKFSHSGRFFGKVPVQDLFLFCYELSHLLSSGLPLLKGLRILQKQVSHEGFRGVLTQMIHDVEGGRSFNEALRKHPRVFNDLFANVCLSGESSGTLDISLLRIGQFIEGGWDLRRKVRSLLTYPSILITASVLVVGLMMVYVVPHFFTIFNRAGIALPLPTRILYQASLFVRFCWGGILLGFLLVIFSFAMLRRTKKGRLLFDRLLLHLAGLGELIQKINLARWGRTLVTLLQAGIPLLQALEMAKQTFTNTVLIQAMDGIIERVEQGGRMTDALSQTPYFPQDMVQLVEAGEESGQLDKMLERSAMYYEKKIDFYLKRLIELAEPLLLIFIGSFVGFIFVSLLLPIFDMIKALRT